MKKIITILFLFLPFVLFCETGDSTETKKIKIGISYSPDYSYRTLKANADNKFISDILDTLEIPKFGYTIGLNVSYAINKRFEIESGILFSDKGERTEKYSLGNSTGDLPKSNTYIYHYRYLDIPVKVNYYLFTGKIKLFLTAGISTNIFLSQKTESILQYGNGSISKNKSAGYDTFSKINFAFMAGLGINYDMTSRAGIKIEPVYSRSINSIIDAPIKSYLYSWGINLGIYYKL